MSNDWIYGEYKGEVDLIDANAQYAFAVLDVEKIDDEHNSPLVQIRLTNEQFQNFGEGDKVTFTLTRKDDGGESEASLIYLDDRIVNPQNIWIKDLEVKEDTCR